MATEFSPRNGNPLEFLHGDWKWLLVFAIILVVMGVVAVFNPLATVLATSIMFGAILLISGISSLITGIANKGFGHRWVDIVFGALAIVAALIIFRSPVGGALSLIWVLGAFYLASGVIELIHAFRSHIGRGWMIFLGLVDVVIGCWILFMPPGSALVTLALIVGFGLIFRGVFLCILSFKLKAVAG